MLTSINPLGEQGRGQRWRITAAFLVIGHLMGGLVFGLLMAGAGTIGRSAGLDLSDATLAVGLAVAASGAVLADLMGVGFRGRRQVDERWLTLYRGWVYGIGFGFQLGLGFVTVVNTALFAVVVVAGVVLPSGTAIVMGLAYASVRAAMALLGGLVSSVDELKDLHRRLDEHDRSAVVVGAITVLGTSVIGATLAVLSAAS